jgi:hypothetical protein
MRTGGLHFTGRLNGGAILELVLHLRLRTVFRQAAGDGVGACLAYDYHAPDRLPGAPVLREACAEAESLMGGIDPPGQVNARLRRTW